MLLTHTTIVKECIAYIKRNDGYYAEFSVVNDGRIANVLSHFKDLDLTGCLVKCLYDLRCKTINYNRRQQLCEMCDSHYDRRDAYLHDKGWLNFGTAEKGEN